MTNNLVGAVPDDNLGIAQEVIRRMREEEGFPERLKLLLAGKLQSMEGVEIKSHPFSKLEKMLSRRFGKKITVDSYPKEFTSEFLANAARYNLKPVFLPSEEISQNRLLKRWIKPETWFYQEISEGKIKPYDGLSPIALRRGWYLADFTTGVDYTDGTQVIPDDPWASLITQLRQEGKIGNNDNTPLGSRFAITHVEWETTLLTYMASKIGVPRVQVRLERAIEFNAIGNLYDHDRGKFIMWEWFSDYFDDSHRLMGGRRFHGGLAGVSYYWPAPRHNIIVGRPLVSL